MKLRVFVRDADRLDGRIEERNRFQPATVEKFPSRLETRWVCGAVRKIGRAVVIILRPQIGLAGALFVAACERFFGLRARFVAGRFESVEGRFEISVFDLTREVQDFVDVSGQAIGAS